MAAGGEGSPPPLANPSQPVAGGPLAEAVSSSGGPAGTASRDGGNRREMRNRWGTGGAGGDRAAICPLRKQQRCRPGRAGGRGSSGAGALPGSTQISPLPVHTGTRPSREAGALAAKAARKGCRTSASAVAQAASRRHAPLREPNLQRCLITRARIETAERAAQTLHAELRPYCTARPDAGRRRRSAARPLVPAAGPRHFSPAPVRCGRFFSWSRRP